MDVFDYHGNRIDAGGGDSDLLITAPKGNNLLNPAYFPLSDYYLSSSDGTTHKPLACHQTNKMTHFGETEKLYVRTIDTYPHDWMQFYFYDADGEYIDYSSKYIETDNFSVGVPKGARYFHLACRRTNDVSANFCISITPLDAFEIFSGREEIEYLYMPDYVDANDMYVKLHGKMGVLFGASNMVGANHTSVADYMSDFSGATVFSAAVGGASMSKRNLASWDAWSMCSIADAIASGDYSALEENSPQRYCPDIAAMLKATDFNKLDFIIIQQGGNDTVIDNPNDDHDLHAMSGALRYSIETISAAYPNLLIYIVSTSRIADETNTVAERNEQKQKIAGEYGLKYIDIYHIGINDYNYTYWQIDRDHQNDLGKKLIAKAILNQMF